MSKLLMSDQKRAQFLWLVKSTKIGLLSLLMNLSACSSSPQAEPDQVSLDQSPIVEKQLPEKQIPTLKLVTNPSQDSSKVLKFSQADLKSTLLGPKKVKRWEPSGVVVDQDHLWVVSDRGGWLARYSLPLQHGPQYPVNAYKLKPDLDHRVKWEGLAWERDEQGKPTALLILEAISRSVWRCDRPQEECPTLTQEKLSSANKQLNTRVPTPFKYIMFEALVYHQGLKVGVRGYQDRKQGLVPWSLVFSPDGSLALDARKALMIDQHTYGLSGADYDQARKGYWFTWSYENEEGSTTEAVRGLLTFLPDLTPSELKLCARFDLKPEGVGHDHLGGIYLVFDEDLDRKTGHKESHQAQKLRFNLKNSEDYVLYLSQEQLTQSCF